MTDAFGDVDKTGKSKLNENWRVRLIEEECMKRMWDVEDVA